jgi:hypothetical protein
VTLALARLTLPRLLLTTLPGLLALLTWLLLPAAAVLTALATLTAVLAALATLLTTLVLLARLLFIRIHNCSLVDPPSDKKRVRTKFLHLLVGYRTVLWRSLLSFAICTRGMIVDRYSGDTAHRAPSRLRSAAEVSSSSDRTRRRTIYRCGRPGCIPTGSAGGRCAGLC